MGERPACYPRCQGADLTRANLSGANLTDANLFRANPAVPMRTRR